MSLIEELEQLWMIGIDYDRDEKNGSNNTIYIWYLTLSCIVYQTSVSPKHASVVYGVFIEIFQDILP